jgi:hypothetical protein
MSGGSAGRSTCLQAWLFSANESFVRMHKHVFDVPPGDPSASLHSYRHMAKSVITSDPTLFFLYCSKHALAIFILLSRTVSHLDKTKSGRVPFDRYFLNTTIGFFSNYSTSPRVYFVNLCEKRHETAIVIFEQPVVRFVEYILDGGLYAADRSP